MLLMKLIKMLNEQTKGGKESVRAIALTCLLAGKAEPHQSREIFRTKRGKRIDFLFFETCFCLQKLMSVCHRGN